MTIKKYIPKLKFRMIIIPLALVAVLLEGTNIFLTNQVSSESVSVSRLSSQIDELAQKNYTLKSEVLEYSSLERVASRAAEMGFAENNKNVISLYGSDTVALK